MAHLIIFKIKEKLRNNRLLYKYLSSIYHIDWVIRKYFKYKIIDRSILLNNKNYYNYTEYSKGENINYKEPIGIDNYIPNKLKYFLDKDFILPPSFYNIHNNVNLIGPEAIGVTGNGEILVETCCGNLNILDKCSPKLFMNHHKLEVERDYEFAVKFVTPYINIDQKNYWHWISECLFLLEAVDHYYKITKEKPTIIINDNPTTYQLDSLKMMGITSKDYVKWNCSRASIKKLIVPAIRRHKIDWVNIIYPSAMKWLKFSLFNYSKQLISKFSQNVFISRQHSNGRRIINNEEVETFLKKYDFHMYSLENMTFKDQLNLFFHAKNIIGVHGAGLSNIIFSNNANIIEIIGDPGHNYTEYYRIAESLNLRYCFILSDYSYDNYIYDNLHSHYKEHDIFVNISRLENIFEKLNITRYKN
jgi:hypothetical protein